MLQEHLKRVFYQIQGWQCGLGTRIYKISELQNGELIFGDSRSKKWRLELRLPQTNFAVNYEGYNCLDRTRRRILKKKRTQHTGKSK